MHQTVNRATGIAVSGSKCLSARTIPRLMSSYNQADVTLTHIILYWPNHRGQPENYNETVPNWNLIITGLAQQFTVAHNSTN